MSFPAVPEELNIEATEESGVRNDFGQNLVNEPVPLEVRVLVTPSTESKAVTPDMTPINISKNSSGKPSFDDNDKGVNAASTWDFYRKYVAEDLVD